jgi:GNAT superfamily N-acetyltransferase
MATDISYVPATVRDFETLAAYRVAFLTELLGPQEPEETARLQQRLEEYFKRALADGTFTCWLAKSGEQVAAVSGMTISVQPGSFKNPAGITGYVMNMYTLPEYRKQGICSNLVKHLMATGKEMGITAFELHATKAGAQVYEKCGFELHNEPTYRRYESEKS